MTHGEAGQLVIDYTLTNCTVDVDAVRYVRLVEGGVTNVATTLSGDVGTTNGSYRVIWDMAADSLSRTALTNAEILVGYEKVGEANDYCVVDLTTSNVVYCSSLEGEVTSEIYKTQKLVLKRIKAGSFIMGEDQTDTSQTVTITNPFYMGVFEVTQKQWGYVTGDSVTADYESRAKNAISYDAIRGATEGAKWPESNAVDENSFLGKLRHATGNLLFDLPTEAQWEYACRAGTTTVYSYGDSADGAYMWYYDNAGNTVHEVGTRLSNDWDLYDMHGNVAEWCRDWYETSSYGADGSVSTKKRVLRGGDYLKNLYSANIDPTSSYRTGAKSSENKATYGFRLMLPAEEPKSTNVVQGASRVSIIWPIDDDPVPEVTSESDITVALQGSADARLAENVKTMAAYNAYRTWVNRVAGANKTCRAAITNAPNAYLAYALDLGYDEAIKLAPKAGDLAIASLERDDGEGMSWSMTFSLAGATVGANAMAAHLSSLFTVEGATTLSDAAFASSHVVKQTFAPQDGKVKVTFAPADPAATVFFLRIRQ